MNKKLKKDTISYCSKCGYESKTITLLFNPCPYCKSTRYGTLPKRNKDGSIKQ